MKVGTRLGVVFSAATGFMLVVGVAAILLIDHLNTVLADISFYNFQMNQVADTMAGIRLAPDRTQQHLARLDDLEKWARTDLERSEVREAREHLKQDPSLSQTLEKLDHLGAYYRKATLAAHDRLVKIHRRAVTGVIIIMVNGALLLLIVMALVRRWLLNPILKIRDSVAAMAAGKSQQPIVTMQNGELADLAGSLNTMSDRLKEAHERLNKSERLATVGEACNHISHTMHSLLASMRTLAEYERKAKNIAPNTKAAFDYIIATTETMQGWVRNMVNTSRPFELRAVSQSLEPVIRDSLSLLQPRLSERKIQVQFEPGESPPDVHLDHALFKQALVAVLANAIDASPDQGRILISMTDAANGTVSLSIQDEGDGMTEDTRQKAFHPFFTNKPDGVGLGLTVAHRIVTAHGGRIEIESQPANGTTVCIHLPAAAGSALPAR